MNEKKFRKGQKVRVTYEATVTDGKPDSITGFPMVWVNTPLPTPPRLSGECSASLQVPVDLIEPIDDPASDPVGTVRKRDGVVYIRRSCGDKWRWYPVNSVAARIGWDAAMEGSEIIGAVPGTPAAQTESDGSAAEVHGNGG